jgi:hypothetical protein
MKNVSDFQLSSADKKKICCRSVFMDSTSHTTGSVAVVNPIFFSSRGLRYRCADSAIPSKRRPR